jgi:hypothetical protein
VKGEFESSKNGGGDKPIALLPPFGSGEDMDLSLMAAALGLLLLGYALRRELRSSRAHTG